MSDTDLSTKTVIFVVIARVIYWCLSFFASFGLSHDIVTGEFTITTTLVLVLVLASLSYSLIQYVFKHKKNRVNDYVIIATSVIFGVLIGSITE